MFCHEWDEASKLTVCFGLSFSSRSFDVVIAFLFIIEKSGGKMERVCVRNNVTAQSSADHVHLVTDLSASVLLCRLLTHS